MISSGYAIKSETWRHQALDVKLKKRRLAVDLPFTSKDSLTTRGQLLFRSNGSAVTIIFLLATNNLQALQFLPWLSTNYNGYPSRTVHFISCTLPIIIENIPQLALGFFFVANQGGFTKVAWAVPLSMTFSAVSIAFALANKGLISFQGDKGVKVGVEEDEFADDKELMEAEEKVKKVDTRLAQSVDQLKDAQAEIAAHKKTIKEFKEQSQQADRNFIELKEQADRDLQRATDKMLEEADSKEIIVKELAMAQKELAILKGVVNETEKKGNKYLLEGEE